MYCMIRPCFALVFFGVVAAISDSPSSIPTVSPTDFSAGEPTVSPSVQCADNWYFYGGLCYLFPNKILQYSSHCEFYCTSISSAMLCIADYSTNDFVQQHLLDKTWIVDPSFCGYSNWAPGEPDGNSYRSYHINLNGKMADDRDYNCGWGCAQSYQCACQRELGSFPTLSPSSSMPTVSSAFSMSMTTVPLVLTLLCVMVIMVSF
jgi:hypothetical protein